MEKAAISVRQLAEQLGISLPKAYELAKQPRFPSIRIGNRIVIPKDSFQKWLIVNSSR